LGKLELIYGGHMISDIQVFFRNGDTIDGIHYKPQPEWQLDLEETIIYSYHLKCGIENFRLDIVKNEKETADRYLSIEPGYGMLGIGYTESVKNNKDSTVYDTTNLICAFNFNFEDFDHCTINTRPVNKIIGDFLYDRVQEKV
jgi:hypothetical protein